MTGLSRLGPQAAAQTTWRLPWSEVGSFCFHSLLGDTVVPLPPNNWNCLKVPARIQLGRLY